MPKSQDLSRRIGLNQLIDWFCGMSTHMGHLWLCCVDRLVPDAIHNQVAVKLLVSCTCFDCVYSMLCTPALTPKYRFVFVSFWFRASCFSF